MDCQHGNDYAEVAVKIDHDNKVIALTLCELFTQTEIQ